MMSKSYIFDEAMRNYSPIFIQLRHIKSRLVNLYFLQYVLEL